MIKLLVLLFPFFLINHCYAQVSIESGIVIIDSGKYEFKQQTEQAHPDYHIAARILYNQVKLDPENAELHYFLGYAIDRLDGSFGEPMKTSNLTKTIQASEQLEEVNRLQPIYKGEIIILDPYAKLSSIWGSLAQTYLANGKQDSALWALKEGKTRGGFNNAVLSFFRQMLNDCTFEAFLITTGDNATFSVLYLQTVEHKRVDVVAIDANLLNASWYPRYLKNIKKVDFSYSDAQLDTLSYIEWKPQTITIVYIGDAARKLSWILKPTYMESYLLRGDRIMLDLLRKNRLLKDVYLPAYSDSTFNLFLDDHLLRKGILSKIIPSNIASYPNISDYSGDIKKYTIDDISPDDIAKSKDAITVLAAYREAYIFDILQSTKENKYYRAKDKLKLMDEKFSKMKLPFSSKEYEDYYDSIVSKIYKVAG